MCRSESASWQRERASAYSSTTCRRPSASSPAAPAASAGSPSDVCSPTVDGLDENGNPASVVIGGGGLIETGIELRTRFSPLGLKAGGVLFLDGGDVTEDAYDLDPTNLHWAVGAGLRFFYLPIGPIRIEVAYRLNRTGPGEPVAGDRFNYLLSIGEAF